MAEQRRPGRFIVLDGPEGSGKSTQAARLVARLLECGTDAVAVRDPGGTAVGERVRQVLLDPAVGDVGPEAEMFLYMASRAELVRQVVRPAIASGRTVVADRFVSSTVVYQGYAGGLDPEVILAAGRVACGDVWPDLVVVLDLPADEGFARIRRTHDRMELKGPAFHRRVVEGFRELARREPHATALVDARGAEEDVADRIWEAVQRVLV